jgi:hypothetical protein
MIESFNTNQYDNNNNNNDNDNNLENSRKYNVENFIQAVEHLFSGNKDLSILANKYINRFNKSSEALDVAIQVLNLENSSEKVYYNAIVVLKNKLKFNFGNYCSDIEKLKILEKIIVSSIEKFKSHVRLYIVQSLCTCLAMLTLFSLESLPNLFRDTTDYFFQLGDTSNTHNLNTNSMNSTLSNELVILQNRYCLISYLKEMGEIPQENNIVVDKEQIQSFVRFLKSISGKVFALLNDIIIENNLTSSSSSSSVSSSSSTIQSTLPSNIHENSQIKILKEELSKSILESILAWLDLGISINELEDLCFKHQEILNLVFKIQEVNLKYHKQCICLLICEQSSTILKNFLIERVLSMKSLVATSIETNNSEGIVFFLDVFEALCTENLTMILENKNKDILLIFLELSKVCDEDRIMYVCDFWENVIVSILEDSSTNTDPDYLNIIDQVFSIMITKTKWSSDVFVRLNKEKYSSLKEDEDFKNQEQFRKSIRSLFLKISEYYSFNDLYVRYFQKEMVGLINSLKNDFANMKIWSAFEALIYCLGCICKRAKVSDAAFLEEIMLTIMEVPIELTQINRTVTDFIDDVSEILHLLPELLKTSFLYLNKGLDNVLTKSK